MILGVIEHDRGTLNKLSLEMLTLGRDLASRLNTSLEAVLIGEEARPLADSIKAYGVGKIYLVKNAHLNDYAPEAWAESVVQLIESAAPQVVMAAGTDRGNEILAHVAARTGLPMAANCTEVHPGETYRIIRSRWGGTLHEEAILQGNPKLLTIVPHVIPAEESLIEGELILDVITPSLKDKDFRVRIVDRAESAADVSLADARLVIGGGRGVGSGEGFAILDELADLCEGAIGCSRVATSNGWRLHTDQIGQTGTRIAPDLYIACGISGATQHMVGCMGSKHILVINTDREAPILSKANYAVIGDLHEVVPALTEAIRQLKDKKIDSIRG